MNAEQERFARELVWNMSKGEFCVGVPSSQYPGCEILSRDMLVLIGNQMNRLLNEIDELRDGLKQEVEKWKRKYAEKIYAND